MLWICAVLQAAEPTPGVTPATTPEATPAAPAAPAAPDPPSGDGSAADPVSGEEIDVYGALPVAEARDALARSLRAEGYARAERHGDTVVYSHRLPYHPRVILHDDGWIEVRRAPIRIRPPTVDYADEATLKDWLICLTVVGTPQCVAPGGLLISRRKLDPLKEEVYEESGDELRQLQQALATAAMERRIGQELPAELARIWGDTSVPAADRRRALLGLWDSRTDTPEGEAARQAIEAFLSAVVQASADPFTPEELAAFEARRTAPRPLALRPAR